jgi:hypothetical protein
MGNRNVTGVERREPLRKFRSIVNHPTNFGLGLFK